MAAHPIVLQMEPTAGNARNSEGAFVTLADGRVVFAWTKFISEKGGDNEPSVIAARFSEDGGRTWLEEERILARPEGGAHNVMSASLLRLQDGRILLMYLAKTNLPDGRMQCTPVVRFSTDELLTLSPEALVTPTMDYHVVNNDRVVQLRDGTLVVPVALARTGLPSVPADLAPTANEATARAQANPGHTESGHTNPGGSRVTAKFAALIFFFLSRDGGTTWWESETSYFRCFPGEGGLQEPGLVELSDGRLWSFARNAWQQGDAGRRQWQSFSLDGGRTWSEPEPSVFVSPCSPLSMKRIPSTGDLLAVWNDHSGRYPLPEKTWERRPLAWAVSSDDGATWKHHGLLDDAPEHGFCYTAVHFVEDAVLLAYCAGGPKPQSCLQRLRMRRVELADIYC